MSHSIRSFIRDITAELLYATGITQPSLQLKNHFFNVVTFHRILPEAQLKSYPIRGIAVTPEEFAWFVKIFSEHFICGTLAENLVRWQAGEKTKRPLLTLTFDDGQLDNFLYAKPILDAAGIRGSFFVVVDGIKHNETLWYDRFAYAMFGLFEKNASAAQVFLKKLNIVPTGTPYSLTIKAIEHLKGLESEERLAWVQRIEAALGGAVRPSWDGMMNWNQLQELVQGGHEIGSHSISHPILPLCSDAQLFDEINKSRRILQNRLDIPVESFCYPNGDYDDRILKVVSQAGYSQAVTTSWGPNRQPDTSQFILRRCDIQSNTSRSRKGKLSLARLAWRLSGSYPFNPK